MLHEIKSLLRDDTTFYSLVIIGVAVCSFGLGRLSVSETRSAAALPEGKQQAAGVTELPSRWVDASTTAAPTPALGTEQAQAGTSTNTDKVTPTATAVVASKSGTKYHFSWCPGAKQIKEENRITFESTTAARAAGYTPAANCPGLE